MSLIYLPTGHRQLADTCALKYNIDRPCVDDMTKIQFTLGSAENISAFYTSIANFNRTLGVSPTNAYFSKYDLFYSVGMGDNSSENYLSGTSTPLPQPYAGPPRFSHDFQGTTAPVDNFYFDWINKTGVSIVISAVTIQADGPLGGTNGVGINAGSGIMCLWQFDYQAASAKISNMSCAFRVLVNTTFSTLTTNESRNLIDYSTPETWLSPSGWPIPAQTPAQTPINKTWTFPIPVTVANNKRFRIQFYEKDAVYEPSEVAIMAPTTVTLHLV